MSSPSANWPRGCCLHRELGLSGYFASGSLRGQAEAKGLLCKTLGRPSSLRRSGEGPAFSLWLQPLASPPSPHRAAMRSKWAQRHWGTLDVTPAQKVLAPGSMGHSNIQKRCYQFQFFISKNIYRKTLKMLSETLWVSPKNCCRSRVK